MKVIRKVVVRKLVASCICVLVAVASVPSGTGNAAVQQFSTTDSNASATSTTTKTVTPMVSPSTTPKPTKTPRPTKTPVPTKTPRPTKTPVPTKTPTATPDPLAMFASFEALCKYASKLDEVEERAFEQQYRGQKFGPWRGRVVMHIPGDSATFYMSGPKYKQPSGAWGRDATLILGDTTDAFWKINEVYDFYGWFFSVVWSRAGGKDCTLLMQTDSRNAKAKIVTGEVESK